MGKKGKIASVIVVFFFKHLCTLFKARVVHCILCLKPNLVLKT